MSSCYKCSCSCNKMKLIKGGYVPAAVNCSRNFSFKNCKEIIIKEELADIFLSSNEVIELSQINTEVGFFTNDKREKGALFLHSDYLGQNDNDAFTIKDNKLKTNRVFYTSGSIYKITVKYVGYKYYKQKDFYIIIKSSKDSSNLPSGEQVQVASSDNSVELIFDNVITPGEVTFESWDSTSDQILIYDINTTAEFDGNITISFNNPNITPSNNPKIIHIGYDDDVPAIVTEGKISAVTSSLSPWGITIVPLPFWTSCFEFGFVVKNDPCPGNQTRGNWAITGNGIGGPREFGGECGCWVPSDYFTVDLILELGTVGAGITALKCGVEGTIVTIKASISSLKAARQALWDAGLLIQDNINGIKESIRVAKEMLETFAQQIQNLIEKQNLLKNTYDELKAQADELLKEIKDYFDIDPFGLITDIDALPLDDPRVSSYVDLKGKMNDVGREIDKTQATGRARQLDMENKDIEIKGLTDIKRREDTLLSENGEDLINNGLETLNQESLLTDAQNLVKDYVNQLSANAIALAAAINSLNEVSVAKTCPSGETLNPLTCECCDNCYPPRIFPDPMNECNCICPPICPLGETQNPFTCVCCPACTNGKIFTDPMNGCDCVCPSGEEPCGDGCYIPCPNGKTRNTSSCGCDCPQGKEPCFSDDNCYDPCEEGKIHAGPDCDCVCIPGDPCPTGQTRNPSSCACECTDQSGCPAGQTRNTSTCVCECTDQSGCPAGQTRNPSSCACECTDYGDELCNGTCYGPCPEGKTRNPSSCACECTTLVPCPTGQTRNMSTCACEPYTPFMFYHRIEVAG